jgi:hypothetical protein
MEFDLKWVSVWAHIETGRNRMAQDHFQTTPGPKKGHGKTKRKAKNILLRTIPTNGRGMAVGYRWEEGGHGTLEGPGDLGTHQAL